MTKKIKSTLLKCCFAAFFGVFFSCSNDLEEVKRLEKGELQPDQTAKEVEVMHSTKGKVLFQLNTPVLHQFEGENSYSEMPEGVKVQIFDEQMVVTSMLTSNYAIDSTYANKMEAHEDVVVVNEKGERLNTEKLYWNRNTEQITSDVFVKITTEDQVIQGTGLISNQDFTKYRILNITGIINIDNDKSN